MLSQVSPDISAIVARIECIFYVEKQSLFRGNTTGLDRGVCDKSWPAHSPAASTCHSSMCSDRHNGIQTLMQQEIRVNVKMKMNLKATNCQPSPCSSVLLVFWMPCYRMQPLNPLGSCCSHFTFHNLLFHRVSCSLCPQPCHTRFGMCLKRHTSTIRYTVLTTCRQTGNFEKDAIIASPASASKLTAYHHAHCAHLLQGNGC